MANRMISLPYLLNERLATENNASALIAKLLEEHFRTDVKDPKEIEHQIDELKKEETEKKLQINESIERLQTNKKILERKQVETIEKKEIDETKAAIQKESFYEVFLEELGRKATDKEYLDFIAGFGHRYQSIYSYTNEMKNE